jgi:hypothetical protein
MGYEWDIPSGKLPFAIENGPFVEIVDLAMKNGDFPLRKRLPEGKP